MNIKPHNIESIRDFIGGIRVIKVKDKHETLKAMDCLEKLSLSTFSAESRKKFEESGGNVSSNFMIKDDEGWRIQSHYIGNGFPVSELECLVEAFGKIIGKEVIEYEQLRDQITNLLKAGKTVPQDIYFRYNALTIKNQEK